MLHRIEKLAVVVVLVSSLVLNIYLTLRMQILSSEIDKRDSVGGRILRVFTTDWVRVPVELDESWNLLSAGEVGDIVYECYTNGTRYAARFGERHGPTEFIWTELLNCSLNEAISIQWAFEGKL